MYGKPCDFYQWHLDWRLPATPPITAMWTRSLKTRPSDLGATFLDDPLKVYESPEADLETAALCLEAMIAHAVNTTDSKEAERSIYKHRKPGVKALY